LVAETNPAVLENKMNNVFVVRQDGKVKKITQHESDAIATIQHMQRLDVVYGKARKYTLSQEQAEFVLKVK
jgi:hypothetical protein